LNLLYVMADDLGFGDLSAYGRRDFRTPALDGLASEGVRLTQAYSASSVCSPTRVALMTGRYPARIEVGLHEPLTMHPTGLSPQVPTLPRLLKAAGYDTALIGKWHLGMKPEYHPLNHGFDEFFGHLGPAVDYVSGVGTENHAPDLFEGTEPAQVEGYLTDVLTARAVQFLSRRHRRPFFLSLQYNAPHWPWQAPGDPVYPDSLGWRNGGSPETYARMVQSLDSGIGQVLTALRVAGLDATTLVIFTSDNGGERYSDMGRLRGGKATLWEGGIRVAAIARWPGVIPPATTSDQVAITMDWTATLLAAGGAQPAAEFPLDGIDLRARLSGEKPVVRRELFWRTFERRRFKAMRSDDWKYLVDEAGIEHLFDLANDPEEAFDRAAERPTVLASFRTAYELWERQMLAPVPLDPQYT
jgi:arylsulfatase A-like enzyme